MLPLAPFGRTGHQSTRVIFGAAALGSMTQDRADATLAAVAASGINHIDTAASYGESEDRLLPWLADHRAEVFLATKTGERRGADARAELERSLIRMGVDQVDMIQLHNLVEPDEWEVAFGTDGAVAALDATRSEGLVRFIGVTGHGLRIAGMHLRSLERFDFDAVLLPYNFTMRQNPDYRADLDRLQALCAERRGRGPDDQVDRQAPLAGGASATIQLVRAVDRSRRHPARRALRTCRPADLPAQLERRSSAPTHRRRRPETTRTAERR